MRRKNSWKKKKVIIGIIAVAIIAIFAFFFFGDNIVGPANPLSVSTNLDNPILLDFCTTESACINYYSQNGMPDGFLEQGGYSIYCENGKCYLKK